MRACAAQQEPHDFVQLRQVGPQHHGHGARGPGYGNGGPMFPLPGSSASKNRRRASEIAGAQQGAAEQGATARREAEPGGSQYAANTRFFAALNQENRYSGQRNLPMPAPPLPPCPPSAARGGAPADYCHATGGPSVSDVFGAIGHALSSIAQEDEQRNLGLNTTPLSEQLKQTANLATFLPGLDIGGVGARICERLCTKLPGLFRAAKGESGLGDLTKSEVKQIQGVVDLAGRPLEVAGSAARGERRGIGTDLPIGKGPGTRSDIDYLIGPSSRSYYEGLERELPGVDAFGPILGTHNPFIGPAIRFEPGARPRFIPGAH